MNKNRKKIRFFLLGCLLLWACFSVASAQWADSETASKPKCTAHPSVCQMTPWTFNLYLDFQRTILALIRKNPFETVTELIDNPQGGLFTNKVLSLDALKKWDDSLIWRSIKIADEALSNVVSSTLTSIFLFEISAIWGAIDNSAWFLVLFHDRPIVRDWAKLLNVERQIIQTAYEIGRAWDITNEIKDSKLIKDVINRYIEKGLLATGSQVPEKLAYADLLFSLYRINLGQKIFLFLWTTSQLEAGVQSGDIQLIFNPDWLVQQKEDYRCVRWAGGRRCNGSFRQTLSNIKALRRNTGDTWKRSLKTISNASKRLWEALGWGQKKGDEDSNSRFDISEGELRLLRDVYGVDTSHLYLGRSEGLFAVSDSWKHKWNEMKSEIKNTTSNVKRGVKNTFSKIKELFRKKRKKNKQQKNEGSSTSSGTQEASNPTEGTLTSSNIQETSSPTVASPTVDTIDFRKSLEENMELLELYEAEIIENADVNDTLFLSQQFGVLTYKVQNIISALGNKNGGLRKEIRDLCDYQCRNSSSVMCYVQE